MGGSSDRREPDIVTGFDPVAMRSRDPVVFRQATTGWPVHDIVADGRLVEVFGAIDIVARHAGRGAEWRVGLGEFVDHITASDAEDGWYAKDWVVADRMDTLVGGDLPPGFRSWLDKLPVGHRPRWAWMFLGANGSGSPLHVDTMCSSAWNLLLSGRKKWVLLSPEASVEAGRLEPEVAEVLDPGVRTVEWEQQPGECLLVPSGWAHRVVNLTPSMALTGNFVNASNIEPVVAHHAAAGRRNWVTLLRRLERVMTATGSPRAGGATD